MEPPGAQRRSGIRNGRPRDEQLTDRFRDSALTIVADRGYRALNADTVVAHANAGKAGLYLRWSSMSDLVADALHHQRLVPTVGDTGSLRGDLQLLLAPLHAELSIGERAAGAITGTARGDETLLVALRAAIVDPLADSLATILDRHRHRGHDIPASHETTIHIVVRALWFERYLADARRRRPSR